MLILPSVLVIGMYKNTYTRARCLNNPLGVIIINDKLEKGCIKQLEAHTYNVDIYFSASKL